MKVCSVCRQQKELSDFYVKSRKSGRLHSQCKGCYQLKRRQTWKSYYSRHGSKYRENAVARNRKLKQALREKMLTYLSDKRCQVCGNSDPRVLEFDHIDPSTKSTSIAKAMHSIWSWEKILAEIEKCQILCANCHKIKTSQEQQWFKATV